MLVLVRTLRPRLRCAAPAFTFCMLAWHAHVIIELMTDVGVKKKTLAEQTFYDAEKMYDTES